MAIEEIGDKKKVTTIDVERYIPKANEYLTGEKQAYDRPVNLSPKLLGDVPTKTPKTLGVFPKWNEQTQKIATALAGGTEADLEQLIDSADELKAHGVEVEKLFEYLLKPESYKK